MSVGCGSYMYMKNSTPASYFLPYIINHLLILSFTLTKIQVEQFFWILSRHVRSAQFTPKNSIIGGEGNSQEGPLRTKGKIYFSQFHTTQGLLIFFLVGTNLNFFTFVLGGGNREHIPSLLNLSFFHSYINILKSSPLSVRSFPLKYPQYGNSASKSVVMTW